MIDAYCHCGTSKYLPLPDVQAVMQRAGVERAVLVQHLGEYDHSYLESVVKAHPDTFKAVGLVDVNDPEWEAALDALLASGQFAGLRLSEGMLRDNPEAGIAAAAAGLALVLELPSGVAASLPAIEKLIGAGARGISVAHFAYPQLEGAEVVRGRELLELAAAPQVQLLLTGHSMWLPFPYYALVEFTAEVIDRFGANRVLWGSNYPVCGGDDDYVRDLELLCTGGFGLTVQDAHLITHANAERLWFS